MLSDVLTNPLMGEQRRSSSGNKVIIVNKAEVVQYKIKLDVRPRLVLGWCLFSAQI